MKRVVLVNGAPASGKSTVARAICDARTWPLLTLDTIKEAFFDHLGTGDRDYSRLLGKASYQAIFAPIKDFPPNSTTVVDAWFGFQPVQVLQSHLAMAGIEQITEVWCHAPAEIIGERYRSRLATRHAGHLGEGYVPELIELARKAKPLGTFALVEVDAMAKLDAAGFMAGVEAAFEAEHRSFGSSGH